MKPLQKNGEAEFSLTNFRLSHQTLILYHLYHPFTEGPSLSPSQGQDGSPSFHFLVIFANGQPCPLLWSESFSVKFLRVWKGNTGGRTWEKGKEPSSVSQGRGSKEPEATTWATWGRLVCVCVCCGERQ